MISELEAIAIARMEGLQKRGDRQAAWLLPEDRGAPAASDPQEMGGGAAVMTTDSDRPTLPVDALERINRVCVEFEASLEARGRPRGSRTISATFEAMSGRSSLRICCFWSWTTVAGRETPARERSTSRGFRTRRPRSMSRSARLYTSPVRSESDLTESWRYWVRAGWGWSIWPSRKSRSAGAWPSSSSSWAWTRRRWLHGSRPNDRLWRSWTTPT